jgi:hypothetical protein
VWTVRRSRRGALRLVAGAMATTAIGYAVAGIDAIRAVGGAGNGNTRASLWDPISSLVHPGTTSMLILVMLFVMVAAWSWGSASRPETTALATMGAYLVGGVYVLPWYPAWALPIAALERRSRLAALVGLHAAFLVAVYEYELPAHPTIWGAPAVFRSVVIQLGAWTALVVFVVLLVRARSPRAEHADADAQRRATEPADLLAGRHPAVVGEATDQVGRVGAGRREEPTRGVLSPEAASE